MEKLLGFDDDGTEELQNEVRALNLQSNYNSKKDSSAVYDRVSPNQQPVNQNILYPNQSIVTNSPISLSNPNYIARGPGMVHSVGSPPSANTILSGVAATVPLMPAPGSPPYFQSSPGTSCMASHPLLQSPLSTISSISETREEQVSYYSHLNSPIAICYTNPMPSHQGIIVHQGSPVLFQYNPNFVGYSPGPESLPAYPVNDSPPFSYQPNVPLVHSPPEPYYAASIFPRNPPPPPKQRKIRAGKERNFFERTFRNLRTDMCEKPLPLNTSHNNKQKPSNKNTTVTDTNIKSSNNNNSGADSNADTSVPNPSSLGSQS